MTKEIALTRGKVALVDVEDYEALSVYKWHFSNRYAARGVLVAGKWSISPMHREILSAPKGCYVDHINGDGLDNRRSNLRLATNAQNLQNRGANKNNTSGFKGVSFAVHAQRWRAEIMTNGRAKKLGYYSTPEEAHAAYCVAALEHHGEFARTV